MPLTYVKRRQQKFQRHQLFFLCTLIVLQLVVDVMPEELEEGDDCISHGAVHGVCVKDKIRFCPGMPRSMASIGRRTIDAVRCSLYSHGELVCCPRDALPISVPTPPPNSSNKQPQPIHPTSTSPAPIPRWEQKAQAACQEIRSHTHFGVKILNGDPAAIGEFPHMAALIYDRPDLVCGGSLIAKKFVLTAAHCVFRSNYQPKKVVLGEINLSNPYEAVDGVYEIQNIYIHSDYRNPEKYNDIAIIELKTEVNYNNSQVFPACLQIDAINPLNGSEDLLVTGWGITNVKTRQRSDRLLKATVRAISLDNCQTKYKNRSFDLNRGILNTQMCTADPDFRVDACSGDSGGPLSQMIDGRSKGIYSVVGIIGAGEGCATSMPSLYTRVSQYLEFIAGIVWQ